MRLRIGTWVTSLRRGVISEGLSRQLRATFWLATRTTMVSSGLRRCARSRGVALPICRAIA
eukprot:2451814-Prymnesium_polylepis.1